MKLRSVIKRLNWRVLFALCRKHTFGGVRVAAFWPDDAATGLAKVEQALVYIQQYGPYQHRRLQSAARILIFGTVGPIGRWHRNARIIQLRETWIEDPSTHPLHVAATIVHEYTHMWLEARRIEYAPAQRRRIERICFRAEARFMGRIPGCEELARYYASCADRVAAESDSDWSDRAFHERSLSELEQLGIPDWLLRLMRKRLQQPPAV